ncbi:MAG TPA: flagellar biosynthetic protein FliO [Oculatellaceae cyanobacterium]
MLGQTSNLWPYLGSFVGYTLLAVGMIYATYWFLKRKPMKWLTGPAFQKTAKAALLEVEANLALEPRKTLYIVRAGQERFLISTTMEQVQCLARLEPEDASAESSVEENVQQEQVTLPWFAKNEADSPVRQPKSGFGARMMQSVQWILETRK